MTGTVDTNLHPTASGAAASTVSAHSSPKPLKLYSGWFCPFVQRAWLVLEEKKVPYQYIEVNPYKKEKEFLALNPRGLVPTLACPVDVDGDGTETKPLYESNIICEYLDSVYSDPDTHGPALLPTSDPFQNARCKIWIDFISTRIVPAFYRFCQHQPHSSYTIESAREEFLGHLKTFIRAADGRGPYFLGEEVSMVDIALAPWLVRVWVLDHFKEGGSGILKNGQDEKQEKGDGDGDGDGEVWARWEKWAQAVGSRESVLRTTSAREWYIPAYQRYAEDTTQSEVARATRAGRGLP